jgi:uncharacterized DUF497 family protein
MAYIWVVWDLEDDLEGNLHHIAEHGVTRDEVEQVLRNPIAVESSRSSGRPIAFGETDTGRLIAAIYEEISDDTVYPETAYEVEL